MDSQCDPNTSRTAPTVVVGPSADPLHPGIPEIQGARRGLHALYLQVPEAVARDVAVLIERAFGALADREAELRRDLWNIAGTIVATCDSGNENLARVACMETSPLVGEARQVIAKYELGNKFDPPV